MMKTSLLAITTFLLTIGIVSGCHNDSGEGVKCVFCEMKVKLPETPLGAKIAYKDGKTEYFCELGHAFKGWALETGDEANPDNPPVGFYVVNYANKEIIDARSAYYVLGSDVSSEMFVESVLAFGDREQASSFVERHGGTVFDFSEIQRENLTKMKMMK